MIAKPPDGAIAIDENLSPEIRAMLLTTLAYPLLKAELATYPDLKALNKQIDKIERRRDALYDGFFAAAKSRNKGLITQLAVKLDEVELALHLLEDLRQERRRKDELLDFMIWLRADCAKTLNDADTK
jgi:hypothetical protein